MTAMMSTIAPNPIAIPHAGVHAIQAGPVLPPRMTGRSMEVPHTRASWKSWPMLVIVLASIAIVVAVVMMVWPPTPVDAGRKIVQPPAPERMETDPLPPAGAGNSNGADPWGGHSRVDPPAPPRQTPDPLPAAPAPAPRDPLGDPFGGLGGATGGLTPGGDVAFAVMAHACTKLKSCPNADDTLMAVCDGLAALPHAAAPACDAEKRCFDAIDKLDCTQDLSQSTPASLMMNMQDCVTAATTC
jgi:hypothetical protein